MRIWHLVLPLAQAVRSDFDDVPGVDQPADGELGDGDPQVEAGLTGHLILTTLHAESTAGVFNRLIEMGVEAPVLEKVPLPEVLSPSAKGFMVRVVSEPSGATVWIDGDERGRAPLFGNVACSEGQEVVIEVAAAGHPRWRRTVPCRVGGELTVRARLGE